MKTQEKKFTINVLDVIIIIIILFGIFVLLYFKNTLEGNKHGKRETIFCNVLITYADKNLTNFMKIEDEIEIGEAHEIGKIKYISEEPQEEICFDNTRNQYIIENIPSKIKIFMKLQFDVNETEKEIKVGNSIVADGVVLPINGQGFSVYANVINVEDIS